MRTAGRKSRRGSILALALTWDGARWPVRALPPKARAFLAGPSQALPSARKVGELFAGDQVREIRLCWVPRLKGGKDVLSDPFATVSGKRIDFRVIKTMRFGDVLGVVYRKFDRK